MLCLSGFELHSGWVPLSCCVLASYEYFCDYGFLITYKKGPSDNPFCLKRVKNFSI